jgi:SAM-dependent methyltransferase
MLKLRKTEPGEPLVVAMTAVRSGDRLLIVGCRATKVIAQLASKPGLAGRACAVDDSAERTARAAAAAERAGALLEIETASLSAMPFERDAFDVVVINHLLPGLEAAHRVAIVTEAARVLRAGGRCVVVQGGRGTGLAGMFSQARRMEAADVEAVLSSAGFRAVHTIAEREGLVFVEGAKRAE